MMKSTLVVIFVMFAAAHQDDDICRYFDPIQNRIVQTSSHNINPWYLLKLQWLHETSILLGTSSASFYYWEARRYICERVDAAYSVSSINSHILFDLFNLQEKVFVQNITSLLNPERLVKIFPMPVEKFRTRMGYFNPTQLSSQLNIILRLYLFTLYADGCSRPENLMRNSSLVKCTSYVTSFETLSIIQSHVMTEWDLPLP